VDHQHDQLGVNFWLPLTTAGANRPGLAIVPLGVEETKNYLKTAVPATNPVRETLPP